MQFPTKHVLELSCLGIAQKSRSFHPCQCKVSFLNSLTKIQLPFGRLSSPNLLAVCYITSTSQNINPKGTASPALTMGLNSLNTQGLLGTTELSPQELLCAQRECGTAKRQKDRRKKPGWSQTQLKHRHKHTLGA